MVCLVPRQQPTTISTPLPLASTITMPTILSGSSPTREGKLVKLKSAQFLRFLSLVPSLFPSGKKPRTNQRRTKERPKNSETQKSTFIKIAHSFTSLIPSPILPTDDREKTDRTPTQLPARKK